MRGGKESGRKKRKEALLVQLLQPAALIPSTYGMWSGVIESLLEDFLRHFDRATLSHLLERQQSLPASAPPGVRAARLASEFSAFHKVCQMLARHPSLPASIRAELVPLERLPPSSIPEETLAAALGFAARATPDLYPEPDGAKVARGSVADVFRFRGKASTKDGVALKFIRADAIPRIRREASILKQMARETSMIGAFVGPDFARTIREALRDASGALLREIDLAGEAVNLAEARAFYEINPRIRIPRALKPPFKEGLFMEFIEGSPLLGAPLEKIESRELARQVFRSLILEPLFSGLPESIFHADPHAGNILLQTHKTGNVIVLLDWSQAGRLAAPVRHALLELCLSCATGIDPEAHILERLLGSRAFDPIPLPKEAGDPLQAALEIVQQLAVKGHQVPLGLLLLRKSLLTVEAVVHQLDPDLSPWRETLIYSAWVGASEAATRVWAFPFPWLDQPRFLRSGLPTRLLAGQAAKVLRKKLCERTNFVDILSGFGFSRSVRLTHSH